MQYFRDTETGALYAFEDNVNAIAAEGGGWTFLVDGDALPAPYPVTLRPTDDTTPPAYVPTEVENAATRDTLLRAASDKIGPLQDAVDMDVATPTEVSALMAWKTYRIALNRMDVSLSPVTWPAVPDATYG